MAFNTALYGLCMAVSIVKLLKTAKTIQFSFLMAQNLRTEEYIKKMALNCHLYFMAVWSIYGSIYGKLLKAAKSYKFSQNLHTEECIKKIVEKGRDFHQIMIFLGQFCTLIPFPDILQKIQK